VLTDSPRYSAKKDVANKDLPRQELAFYSLCGRERGSVYKLEIFF
jgi:hypothetical protein